MDDFDLDDLSKAHALRAALSQPPIVGGAARQWHNVRRIIFDHGVSNATGEGDDARMISGYKAVKAFEQKIKQWGKEELARNHGSSGHQQNIADIAVTLDNAPNPPTLLPYEREAMYEAYLTDAARSSITRAAQHKKNRRIFLKSCMTTIGAGLTMIPIAPIWNATDKYLSEPELHPEQRNENTALERHNIAEKRSRDAATHPSDDRRWQRLIEDAKISEKEAYSTLVEVSQKRKEAGLPNYDEAIVAWEKAHELGTVGKSLIATGLGISALGTYVLIAGPHSSLMRIGSLITDLHSQRNELTKTELVSKELNTELEAEEHLRGLLQQYANIVVRLKTLEQNQHNKQTEL